MHLFKKDDHNILVVNNEYTNQKVIYGNRNSQSAENIDDINDYSLTTLLKLNGHLTSHSKYDVSNWTKSINHFNLL